MDESCSEKSTTSGELIDPDSRFLLNEEKVHLLDGQSVKDVTNLWRAANKTLYPTLKNGIFPLLGQSQEEVNALLDISEKQGERSPMPVEQAVVSEQTIEEIKKHMQILDSFHERCDVPPQPVCTGKKRKTKYERLKAKYARLEMRVANLEQRLINNERI